MLLLLLLLLALVICPHQYIAPRQPGRRVINTVIAFILHSLYTAVRHFVANGSATRNYCSLAFVLRRSSSVDC